MIAKTFILSGPVGSLPGLFESNPLPFVVNGSPWTLRYEAICYVVLLAGSLTFARSGARAGGLWIPVTTLSAGLVMILAPAGPDATMFDHLLRFWFAFGLGAMVYQFRAFVGRAASVAACWTALAGIAFITSIGSAFECTTAILFVGAVTLFLARLPLGRLRGLTNRFDLSYGVYITAWPITQILVANAPGLPFFAMLAAIMDAQPCPRLRLMDLDRETRHGAAPPPSSPGSNVSAPAGA